MSMYEVGDVVIYKSHRSTLTVYDRRTEDKTLFPISMSGGWQHVINYAIKLAEK